MVGWEQTGSPAPWRRKRRATCAQLGQVVSDTKKFRACARCSLASSCHPTGASSSFLFFLTVSSFLRVKGGGMSEWRVTGDPQKKAPLCGGRAVQQPTRSRGRRLGSHHRVRGEGRLLSAVSAEGGGAEEAGPSSGRPKFVKGTFFCEGVAHLCGSCCLVHHTDKYKLQLWFPAVNIPNKSRSNSVSQKVTVEEKVAKAAASCLMTFSMHDNAP